MSGDRPTKAQRKNAARDKARQMREEAERRQKRNRVLVAVLAVVAVLAIVLGVGLVVRNVGGGSGENAATPKNVGDAGQIVVGDAAAPATVSVYLDYQCPACKAFEDENQQMLETMQKEGKVAIEYHPVSILDRFSSGTRFSTRSAGAAFCVADQAPKAFPEFNKQMFANQPPENQQGLTNEKVTTIATLAGAPESVGTCIDKGTYEDYATRMTQKASADGLTGTPWVKLNGQEVTNALQPGALQAAINQVLAAGGGASSPSAPAGTATTG